MPSLIPKPEEEEKGPGFSRSRMCLIILNYLEFNHVLISGRVPMTSSMLHGLLYDVAIQCFKSASLIQVD